MKFGLVYEAGVSRDGADRLPEQDIRAALEQVKIAEDVGFVHVWSVEHHALDDGARALAPEIWLSAIAQHTQRIRVGHGVRLLPLDYTNPIRVAEMAAVLDIMSEGRLDFGTGRPASNVELQGAGIDPAEMWAQWDEVLRMIPQMWIQEAFSWDSDHFKMPSRNILPKPVQSPHPPMWMSGSDADAARFAGERGIGFMSFPRPDVGSVAEEVNAYREAIRHAERVGESIHRQFAVCADFFCGCDDADAARRVQGDGRTKSDGADSQSAIVGGPGHCIDRIESARAQGVDEILFRVELGALAHEDICDSLRRFGREVLPHFLA